MEVKSTACGQKCVPKVSESGVGVSGVWMVQKTQSFFSTIVADGELVLHSIGRVFSTPLTSTSQPQNPFTAAMAQSLPENEQ